MENVGHDMRKTWQAIEYDARACFSKSGGIFAEAEIEVERARTLREWARHEFKTGNKEQGKNVAGRAGYFFQIRGTNGSGSNE